MKTNHQQSKLHCMNKRGYIFVYDMLVAVFIFIIIIIASTLYAGTSNEDKLSNTNTVTKGSDIINVLIKTGSMDSLEESTIRLELEKIIPQKYDINIDIVTNEGDSVSVIKEIPENVFVASGKRYFVTSNNKIAKVEYKIWPKE